MKFWMKMLWLCLLLLPIVGCRGCKQDQPKTNETAEEAEKRKKKQRLVVDELRALPFTRDIPSNFVKPGHWYQANHKLKANLNDESLTVTLSILNREKKSVPFALNQVPVEFNRNLSLAMTQEKNIQLKMFVPEVGVTGTDNMDSQQAPASIDALYSQRGIGTPVFEATYPSKLLAGYQYNLVSISRDPSRFLFWRGLDCIVWQSKQKMADERISPHRVVDLKEDEVAVQFPNQLYAMTSISHLVVNDASLSILSPDQQQAVQDWLHFGGTIILNGPEALAGIEASFIKEICPLDKTQSVEMSQADINLLNEGWSIKQALGDRILFGPTKPISRLTGELSDESRWVAFTGNDGVERTLEGLVAERLVGQGRVVMTTFPMNDLAFLKWPSYSSFIHNVILRKPHRDTTTGNEADTRFAGEMEGSELNPLHSTRLRIWARDLDGTTIRNDIDRKESQKTGNDLTLFKSTKKSSLGAWNSDSVIVNNARTALQESSGITVPKINTIVKLLLGYLLVLVPINWLVFRLMGRVELAWAAAPLIAIVGAFVVARSVQLDVGFSRSQTSYGFLECHAEYPRGLLSNYTALYTSLSTNYRAVYGSKDSGVVLGLPSASTGGAGRKTRSTLSKIDYWYADESGDGMQSTPVLSNTTGLFQSEEMVDIGGAIHARFSSDLGTAKIKSDSQVTLHDMGIIGLGLDGRFKTGWIGDLQPGGSINVNLEGIEKGEVWRNEWEAVAFLSKPNLIRDDIVWTERELGSELYLGPMLEQVARSYPLGVGEFIALGWTDQSLAKLEISPVAKQRKERTVVLLHLRSADLGSVRPDLRIFQKIVDEFGN
jgi:hypothetical protein